MEGVLSVSILLQSGDFPPQGSQDKASCTAAIFILLSSGEKKGELRELHNCLKVQKYECILKLHIKIMMCHS